MDFKVPFKGWVDLHSNDVDLKNRWVVVNSKKMEERTKSSWGWFNNVQNRKFERTKLHLAYDKVVGRPVIAKTVCYRPDDLQSRKTILERRSILTEQIDLLNAIASPLLPEPLDWFNVTNTVDGLPEDLRDSEPVLILDYQPGLPLEYYIAKKKLRFRQVKDKTEEPRVDTTNVGRIALRILYFIRILREHNYAYLDLNPEHILLLNNYIPRFVGLGRICKTINGCIDDTNINFGMTSRGYSAPELNDFSDNWKRAREATAEQIGAFSLGVIIHQMVSETTEFTADMIKKGSFIYPNGVTDEKIQSAFNGEKIHELISKLCEHNPQSRLSDLDEIEERLRVLAGETGHRRNDNVEKNKSVERRCGWVKWYDDDKKYGFLVCKDTLKEYHISKTNLEKTNVATLSDNMRVAFDVVTGAHGDYATNVKPIVPPERQRVTPPKRPTPPPPRRTPPPPPRKTPTPPPRNDSGKSGGILDRLKKLFFS